MICYFIIGLLWLIATPNIHAETIGLGFWVDDQLAQTSAQKQALEHRLARQVDELNTLFRDSQVDLMAMIVNIEYIGIEHKNALKVLDEMVAERNGFVDLFSIADEHGADYNFAIVSQLTLRGKQNCGRAYAVNKTPNEIASIRRAIAVINGACGAQTLAHELGHLQGLNHGNLVDACLPGKGYNTALTQYALGYAQGNCDRQPQPGEFGTIMVGGYMQEINGDGRSNLPLFSNARLKDIRCGSQGVCGNVEFADAARVLNDNAPLYAAHAEPDVHTLTYASTALAECVSERYRFAEIDELTELACPNAGITTIEGIQQLKYLQRIDLSGNPIVDARQLLIFPAAQIESVNLSNTNLSSASVRELVTYFGTKVVLP